MDRINLLCLKQKNRKMAASWLFFIVTLCIIAIVKSLQNLLFSSSSSSSNNNNNSTNNLKLLPPGPPAFPVIGNLFFLRKSLTNLEPIIGNLIAKHGPFITFRVGSKPTVVIASHSLAHQALVRSGPVFAGRPEPSNNQTFTSNQLNITSAGYGPIWRLLRRNLAAEILHPSRIKSYSRFRIWVLEILIRRLDSESRRPIKVVDHFQYAVFRLLAVMCFGDEIDQNRIGEIQRIKRRLLLRFNPFNILNFFPKLGKILFPNYWKELIQLRREQESVLLSLIRDRIEANHRRRRRKEKQGGAGGGAEEEELVAYVDTLAELELPDEKRKLYWSEMATLCSEFLTAGTDTTSAVLQWVMANIVKYPEIQEKLYKEIVGVVGRQPPGPPPVLGRASSTPARRLVEEGDLQRMPYLKAVVLEALRRHPPGHFLLPHSATEDVELGGYFIPKNTAVNFLVAEMNRDPKVWENPMEFRPERFLNLDPDEVSDLINGSREIKMMSFGAGRRICPATGLALLHLEFFVANLVWSFEWMKVDDNGVDLSEKQEFSVVMKNPLLARIRSRFEST